MASDLLAAKLHAPHPGRRHVARPRLAERMGGVTDARVTLVAAPAGFGKTTLVADWLATTAAAVAWVSLESTDDDPRAFWRYVLAALDRAVPGVQEEARKHLDRPDVTVTPPSRRCSTPLPARRTTSCSCSMTCTASDRPRSMRA